MMTPLPTRTGPLVGLKVPEIGLYIAAPFCTRILADLGAEVIKIGPPGGDPFRGWGVAVDGALQPEALPAEVPAARARPAQPAVQTVAPPPPPVRAEARPAIIATAQAGQPAPAARAVGPIQAGLSDAMKERILSEIAARAVAASTAIAA
jgi:hypothetical protein